MEAPSVNHVLYHNQIPYSADPQLLPWAAFWLPKCMFNWPWAGVLQGDGGEVHQSVPPPGGCMQVLLVYTYHASYMLFSRTSSNESANYNVH